MPRVNPGNGHIQSQMRRWKVTCGIALQFVLGQAFPGHHCASLFNPDKLPRVIFFLTRA